jgi:pSer/pThr/pTyr-binding forkhead associated (FHA) protein
MQPSKGLKVDNQQTAEAVARSVGMVFAPFMLSRGLSRQRNRLEAIMDSTVTLLVTRGPLTGQQFVFDEPTTCHIGRSRECTIVLPLEAEHLDVSRHHCVLDIAPPTVRVRDLGSLNGTFVNGRKIGQRSATSAPADVKEDSQPMVPLIHGDEVRLGGHTAFRVSIFSSEWDEAAQSRRHSSGELTFEIPMPT